MKRWHASDPDHIPRGRRVLILAPPRDAARIAGLVGFPLPETRTGTIERRQACGSYLVKLENSRWTLDFERSELLYPAPANVVAFDPARRGRRR